MKTRHGLFALALLLASCKTRNENSLLPIVSVVPPVATFTAGSTPGTGSLSCKFDPGTIEFTELPYNPAENRGSIAAVVQNNLTPTNTLSALLRTDSSTFLPHEAVVSFELIPAVAGVAPNPNTVPVSGLEVPSGTKATVGIDIFAGTPISVPNGTFIRVTFSIKGKLLDGSIVHTSEREYLFRYCNTAGCGVGGTWAASTGTGFASCL